MHCNRFIYGMTSKYKSVVAATHYRAPSCKLEIEHELHWPTADMGTHVLCPPQPEPLIRTYINETHDILLSGSVKQSSLSPARLIRTALKVRFADKPERSW